MTDTTGVSAELRAYVAAVVDQAPPLSFLQRDVICRALGKEPSAVTAAAADAERRRQLWGEGPSPMIGPARPTCCLYRHRDHDGVLLYVGISTDPHSRRTAHASSAWLQFADRSRETWEWFDERADAEAAERLAIHTETPLFNVVDNGDRMTEAAVRYLVAHECWDALRWSR